MGSHAKDKGAVCAYCRNPYNARMTRTQYLALAVSALAVFSVGIATTTYAPISTIPGLPAAAEESSSSTQAKVASQQYIEVMDGCGPYFDGECLNMRTGPGTEFPVAAKLRRGVVLHIGGPEVRDGMTWYKIVFDEWLRYPERAIGNYYVAGEYVRPFSDEGVQEMTAGAHASTTKHIIVDRSEQMLYAYDGDALFMQTPISTGIELTPTPRGVFAIFRKTPSRYMQGPIPGISTKEYDLPGVPWNLYFTEQGAVIHGAYWHDHFGEPWSNGCVNVPLDRAQELYQWADLGTQVTVQD